MWRIDKTRTPFPPRAERLAQRPSGVHCHMTRWMRQPAMPPISVLLVDDDCELTQMLSEYLSTESFRVAAAADGSAAMAQLANATFDLVVLDVMLPSLNGFDILRRLRQTRTTPVIMLTARGEDVDRILGLELGADDYLAKPFNPRELVARIRAVLRRSVAAGDVPQRDVVAGPLRLNPTTLDVVVDGTPVRLTGTEFRVLEMLVRGIGQVQSRASLTEQVLGRRLSAYDRSIDTHVSNLRRKLVDAHGRTMEIRNLRGAGYMLTGNRDDRP
jgi:DNA-binding response OmpR family regulator